MYYDNNQHEKYLRHKQRTLAYNENQINNTINSLQITIIVSLYFYRKRGGGVRRVINA